MGEDGRGRGKEERKPSGEWLVASGEKDSTRRTPRARKTCKVKGEKCKVRAGRGGMAKRKSTEEAELILRLYELRRETVMRQARSYVGGKFAPGSAEEFVGIVSRGDAETGYVLQVYGYWDMVCAFVLHGMLSEGLVYDTCQEMYFQYAKIQPHLKEFRVKMGLPEWMQNLERVIEGSAKGRKRIAMMRGSIEKIVEERRKN
jgi:hypothetical protein